MKFEEIIQVIRKLSYSQGFYGRLLEDIYEAQKNNSEALQEWIDELESQHFSDELDLILYLEEG